MDKLKKQNESLDTEILPNLLKKTYFENENAKKYAKVDKEEMINCLPGQKPLVEIRDVSVQFGYSKKATHAVKQASFNIYNKEVVGLVGESGSGKSTLGNSIMGLVNRQNGVIKIDDLLIPQKTQFIKNKLRKQISLKAQMIFQDPTNSLNSQKKVRQIISEGLDNVNVETIFAKQFDIFTVVRLSRILNNSKQPPYVEKIVINDILKMIKEEKLVEVYQIIYVNAKKHLQEMDNEVNYKAATFLDLRSRERQYFLSLSKKKKSSKKIKDHLIIQMLNAVGLSRQVLNRYPLEFSGGQQQRISISRSVVMKPTLLIADEPISALDVSIQAQVVNIFNELKNKLDLTILFIAHDLRMVEYISDRILVMYKGDIIEMGNAKEVAKNPVHPYTKSLLASVPSIDKIHMDLKLVKYDPTMHNYSSANQPNWYQINKKLHFVLGTEKELEKWTN